MYQEERRFAGVDAMSKKDESEHATVKCTKCAGTGQGPDHSCYYGFNRPTSCEYCGGRGKLRADGERWVPHPILWRLK